MKNQFDELKQRKEIIIKFFDKLAALVPKTPPNARLFGQEAVLERKGSFDTERWILAAVGEVKTGKSSLLNALVFGTTVLPESSTPLTAKLTQVVYSEHKMVEITFISRTEEKELLNTPDTAATDANDQSLKEQFEEYKHRFGTFPKDKYDQTIEVELADLGKYVSPLNNGGEFTPYVKEVKIGWPNDILKTLTVVDTPGLNDPVVSRSNLTESWISNAHCAIFTTYSGRAFPDTEFQFLDRAMSHIAAELRLFAVNKWDLTTKKQKAEIVEDINTRVIKRAKGQIKKDKLFYVSGLGSLTNAKKSRGEPLNSTEELLASKTPDFLSPDTNKVDELRQVIVGVLIADLKGSMMTAPVHYLKEQTKKYLSYYQQEVAKIDEAIADRKKSAAEIKKERAKIKHQQNEINNFANQQAEKLSSELTEIYELSALEAEKIWERFRTRVEVDNSNDCLEFPRTFLADSVTNFLREHRADIMAKIESSALRVETKVQQMDGLASSIKGVHFPSPNFVETIRSTSQVEDILAGFENELEDKKGFVETIFWPREKTKNKAMRAVLAAAKTKFIEQLLECVEAYHNSVLAQVGKFMESFQADLMALIEERDKSLEKLLKDEGKLEEEEKTFENQKQKLISESERFNLLLKEIEATFAK